MIFGSKHLIWRRKFVVQTVWFYVVSSNSSYEVCYLRPYMEISTAPAASVTPEMPYHLSYLVRKVPR
jgi:hypothetical protein